MSSQRGTVCTVDGELAIVLTTQTEWLMVVVENQSTPVIWRVIQEGYPITTDEVSLWAGFAGRDNN